MRQNGKSFAHPLVVLIVLANPQGTIRVGISAGRTVGTAVTRNRIKRRLRASMDRLLPIMSIGWDLILIARAPARDADFDQIFAGVHSVLQRAGLLQRESADLNDRERIPQ